MSAGNEAGRDNAAESVAAGGWRPSVLWCGDYLEMLDQRLLPEQTVYLELRTIEDVWDGIRTMKVRGAPAIGIAAAFGVYLGVRDFAHGAETTGATGAAVETARATDPAKDSAEASAAARQRFLEEIRQATDYLAKSRPTAVNLFWALDRMKARAEAVVASGLPIAAVKLKLLEEAKRIQAEDEETCRLIGEHALSLFSDGMGVLTHCNAGGLATARYGTALAPMYLAQERGIKLKVFADETRPALQGARLTAYELQQAGVDVTLICDNTAGMVMAKGWVQAVIVGTDRVAANGDVANKIGTYSVAVLAKAHGIPFYVACPLSTIDLNTSSGQDIPIEERADTEVTEGFGKRTAPQGIKVYNPVFDVTPNDLVTAIITEKGIVRAPYKEGLASLFN